MIVQGVEPVVRVWADNPERAVIFDFNGTLSDDEPILLEIYTRLFREHLGWQMDADYYRERLLGHSDREIVERVVTEHGGGGDRLSETLLGLRRTHYRRAVADRSPISAEATAVVRRLDRAGVPMAIVTGAEGGDVRAVLDGGELGRLIDVLVCEEDVARGKPDPEGFLMGAALLHRSPRDVLVFEDSLPGVVAAKSAGMTCVAVVDVDSTPAVAAAADMAVPRLTVDLLESLPL